MPLLPSFPMLKAKGLNTSPNSLNSRPGGLSEASNVIIKRDDVIEPRRGNKLYGNSFGSNSTRAKQLFEYKNRILRYYNNVLQFDTETIDTITEESQFESFSGTYTEPESNRKIRGLESNGNFYFTTNDGIKKISVSSANDLSNSSDIIYNAGPINALNLYGKTKYTAGSITAFLPQDSVVGYRQTWIYKDANNKLIEGSPSELITIYNSYLTSLTNDFNLLLNNINHVVILGSSLLTNTDYISNTSSGYLSENSDATTILTHASALATKLDTDIEYTEGAINTASVQRTSVTSGQLVFNSSVANYIAIGDKITCSGFTAGGGATDWNGKIFTVTNVVTTTVTCTPNTNFSGTDAGIADTGGVVNSYNYRNITVPTTPSNPPTHDELITIKDYIQSIIDRLQLELTGVIPSGSKTTFIDVLETTSTSTVNLTFNIPSSIVLNKHAYRIYRTRIKTATGTDVLSDLDAGDETYLVLEDFPTSTQLSAKTITVEDITPDEFSGTFLYTNEDSGEGILKANNAPPIAKDITLYKGYTFFANTKTKYRQLLTLLGISNLTNSSKITITNGSYTNTYSFVTGVSEVTNVATLAASTLSGGEYFNLYSGKDETAYYVWYVVSGTGSDPSIANKTGIRVDVSSADADTVVATKTRDVLNTYSYDFSCTASTNNVIITNITEGVTTNASDGNTGFTISVTTPGVGEDITNKKILISPLASPSQATEETVKSLINVINSTTNESVYAYYLGTNQATQGIPGYFLLESRNLSDSKFYIMANNDATGDSFNPNISPTITISGSTNADPTVITTSTAHGLVNQDQVIISGSDNATSIDGLYTITYLSSTTFSIDVPSAPGIGTTGGVSNINDVESGDNEEKVNYLYYSKYQQTDSVPILQKIPVGSENKQILRIVALRDSLFILKEDGVWRLTGLDETSFTVSLFDGSCICIAPDSVDLCNNLVFAYTTQGVQTISEGGISIISRDIDIDILKLSSYPNFRLYTWGLGYESDNSYTLHLPYLSSDTKPTLAYRFSTLTSSWTTFDISKTCGLIKSSNDKMYLGAGDTNYIEEERKNFSREDYADRELSNTFTSGFYLNNGLNFYLSDVDLLNIGDVIVQEQYLTIYIFNLLLKKLDADLGVTDTNYYSLLHASPGDSLREKLVDLATKLDSDTGVSGTNYLSSINSYTQNVANTNHTATNPTVITTSSPHNLVSGRYISISGSDSTPSLDGYYPVTVLSSTTFSIPVDVTIVGSVGNFTYITLDGDFRDINTCYNTIVSLLNSDSSVNDSNYLELDYTTQQECIITDINRLTSQITVNIALPFIVGAYKVYKTFETNIVYQLNHLGDPIQYKHIPYATIMFENLNFTTAILSFATDLVPSFSDIEFNGQGTGILGHQSFGSGYFGGVTSTVPFITLLPRDKQRCRFILIKFSHNIAREKYSIFGISLSGQIQQSHRAYK